MTLYYQDDHVTLYHGDCLTEHREWLEADVLVSDVPYGVSYSSGWDNKFRKVTIANDETVAARDEALAAWGDRPALVFGSWKAPRPAATRAILIWDKGTVGMGAMDIPWFPCTEEIYVLRKGFVGSRTSAVMRHVGRNQHHPTEKPLPLMQQLVHKCPPGTIADPFAGSGATLLAARNLGRKAVGVELEERYCEVIAKRLDQGVLDIGALA